MKAALIIATVFGSIGLAAAGWEGAALMGLIAGGVTLGFAKDWQ